MGSAVGDVALGRRADPRRDRAARARGDPRFATNEARVANVEELDAIIQGWMSEHTLEEVLAAFEAHEAAVAPIYDAAQIANDPQYRARAPWSASPTRSSATSCSPTSSPACRRRPGVSATPGCRRARRTTPSTGASSDSPRRSSATLSDDGVI